MVFGLAVVLVFTILIIHFRAWLPATLILLAAPLSLGGAFLPLALTGTELNVSAAMGMILLIGLVVKNGIMLLDVSEHLHERGEPFDEAIAHAGPDPSPPDSHDDVLHVVRPAAARTRTGRGRGVAEATGPGRDWRPHALDAGDAAGHPRAVFSVSSEASPAGKDLGEGNGLLRREPSHTEEPGRHECERCCREAQKDSHADLGP